MIAGWAGLWPAGDDGGGGGSRKGDNGEVTRELNAAEGVTKLVIMKRRLPRAGWLALACGLASVTSRAGTGAPLPTPFPETRYEEMSARSPFAVSTAAAGPAATPGFAAQLYVDGVAHVGNRDYVAIKSRDPGQPNAIFLEVGQLSEDGMKVERVRWSDEMGRSTVDVSKGGEEATLAFDEELMAKTPAAVIAPGQPGVPLIRNGIDFNDMPGPLNAAQARYRQRIINRQQ